MTPWFAKHLYWRSIVSDNHDPPQQSRGARERLRNRLGEEEYAKFENQSRWAEGYQVALALALSPLLWTVTIGMSVLFLILIGL